MRQTSNERPRMATATKGRNCWFLTVCYDIQEETPAANAAGTVAAPAANAAGTAAEGETSECDVTLYSFECVTVRMNRKPTSEDALKLVIEDINKLTDEKILNGYEWTILHGADAGKTVKVWLSKENQNNFKAKHDAALVYPEIVTFPMTYKVSEDDSGKAVYEVFESIQELAQFYLGGLAYIEQCYGAGWQMKDSLKAEDYVL